MITFKSTGNFLFMK